MGRLAIWSLVFAAVTTVGCATRVEFPVSSTVPAAVAKVKITEDDNGNSIVRLRVEHLAPPERLSPPRSLYVVWLVLPDTSASNLGALRVDKNLEGELRTVTAHKEFRLIVTAEDSSQVPRPGHHIILTTDLISVD